MYKLFIEVFAHYSCNLLIKSLIVPRPSPRGCCRTLSNWSSLATEKTTRCCPPPMNTREGGKEIIAPYKKLLIKCVIFQILIQLGRSRAEYID